MSSKSLLVHKYREPHINVFPTVCLDIAVLKGLI